MLRPLIAANWKMHKTLNEARDFLDAFVPSVTGLRDRDIVLAPPFTALGTLGERLKGTNVLLCAQDVFYEEKGAYTGEISPLMLKDVGCDLAIVGHSERRQYFSETDDTVNRKIKAAQKNGLDIICCIGESLTERESGKTYDVLAMQITQGLRDADPGRLIVAYEPVWAIGTGKTATTEQAQEAHSFIRGALKKIFGSGAEPVRILYGGSVTPENIDGLMACPDVDGGLVGGASLRPDSFEKIVKFRRGTQ